MRVEHIQCFGEEAIKSKNNTKTNTLDEVCVSKIQTCSKSKVGIGDSDLKSSSVACSIGQIVADRDPCKSSQKANKKNLQQNEPESSSYSRLIGDKDGQIKHSHEKVDHSSPINSKFYMKANDFVVFIFACHTKVFVCIYI